MRKCITLKNIADEDWKTQLAKGYADIPKGTECEVIGYIHNLYGTFVDIVYNGRRYSTYEDYIKYIGEINEDS